MFHHILTSQIISGCNVYVWMLHFKANLERVNLCLLHIILLVTFPLISMQCPSPSLLINFGLKSILSNVKFVTPACFLDIFACNTFPHPYCEAMPVLGGKVCFLDASKRCIPFSIPVC